MARALGSLTAKGTWEKCDRDYECDSWNCMGWVCFFTAIQLFVNLLAITGALVFLWLLLGTLRQRLCTKRAKRKSLLITCCRAISIGKYETKLYLDNES